MPFSTYTDFRNFVFEYCNRHSTFITNNFDYFLLNGSWEFIKKCLPLGAVKRFEFIREDAGIGNNLLKILSPDVLYMRLSDIKTVLSYIPYAIEDISVYRAETVDTTTYYEFRTLPYLKFAFPLKSFKTGGTTGWTVPFWTFQVIDRNDDKFHFYFHIPQHLGITKVYIEGLWLPLNLENDEVLWRNYDEGIALFTYYLILRALNEWSEMQVVWSECVKMMQEMQGKQGVKKFIFPFQYADYLLLGKQAVGGEGEK